MGCRESKNKEPTTGELSQTTTADDQVKALVSKVKADVEAQYGKEFTTFEPVSFRKQAVAQNVYYVKIDLGGEYAHIKVCDTVPKECEKAATSKASPEKKSEEKKEEDNSKTEEKGEGSEEKGEGSEDAKDGSEEKETKSTEEVAVVKETSEEKPTATLTAVQKGKKLNDEIVEFETSEEASEEEEEVTEEPKEEVKEEEPKEEEVKEEPKEEEPKEEEPKEEEPKKEEDKEEEKEEGDSSLLSTLKSEASDALGF
ncbi:uncharacterized protein LOC128184643 isoform X2 [Crassostrea angulata]|uniref:uncharacterized protein LOC128184643 isoform X2 n=1 Tax=Magallana angulata TaxID=2784310 RepID=UPI0022B18D38|nr:uncharacterized protein LOC128184643 isoform X2 [Crassostrea angulata]